MKNKFILSTILVSLLAGCEFSNLSNQNSNSSIKKNELSIIVPTGAPSVAFLNYLNDDKFSTNTVPNNIVAEMLKGSNDIVVVDLIGGLTAIEKKSANYKLASIITFGNFYIYATGNDQNNLMEEEDNIVCFGQNNTPDILFNHLYPNIGVDYYQPGISDIASIAASGKLEGENIDYCVIAEPVLYNILNNQKAPTYGKGYKYSSFQDEWKKKYGENSSILGAGIYVNNETYTNKKNDVNIFLRNIKNDIEMFLSDSSIAVKLLDEFGSKEEQAAKIGINSNIIDGVIKDNNSINLGYLCSESDGFDEIVQTYLNVVKPDIINKENYL